MTDTEKEQEIWKTYSEFPFIEVNQFGEVRTKDRWVLGKNGSKRLINSHVIKQQLLPNGYLYVHINANGKIFNRYVHRIVATCFVPNTNNLPEVNHIDNDPANNVVSNLEWCSHEYNMAYKEKYGTSAAEVSGRPVFAVDLKTGKVLRFETQSEAAYQLGVDVRNLNNVVRGRANQTGGYWFTEDKSEITEKKTREIKDNMYSLCGVFAINPETKNVFFFKSQHDASRQLNVHVGDINRVIKGKRNKAGGCWFTYANENAVETTRAKFGDEIAKKVEKLISKNF